MYAPSKPILIAGIGKNLTAARRGSDFKIATYNVDGVNGRMPVLLHAAGLVKQKSPVVLAGDYNVIPTDIDVYKPERWLDDALFRPESRAAYRELLDQGWSDALRQLHPSERIYTFWDYFRNSYGRDAGLRIEVDLRATTRAIA